MPVPIDRPSVLSVIIQQFPVQPFTTNDIAALLNAREYQVRSCISWLLLAGVIKRVGALRRTDRSGRAYFQRTYAWNGASEIRRVNHDPARRRADREQASPTQALAATWLSRRW